MNFQYSSVLPSFTSVPWLINMSWNVVKNKGYAMICYDMSWKSMICHMTYKHVMKCHDIIWKVMKNQDMDMPCYVGICHERPRYVMKYVINSDLIVSIRKSWAKSEKKQKLQE